MDSNKKTLFITGAAGYVGAMLCEQFSKRSDVDKIVALDIESKPELLEGNSKIVWIDANTSDGSWQDKVGKNNPDIVIHPAWQIREMYGKKETQWKWNVDGSNDVFDFAFSTKSVSKLIYFSTASSYGAQKGNTLEHYFKEEEGFRDDDYLYALEKKKVEENLHDKWTEAKKEDNTTQVFIVRPAAITGPRGRYMRIRFGLQAALGGQLKETFIHRMVTFLVSYVPATPMWCRQFIHEDDVTDIVELLSFEELKGEYEVFNITPPGKPVLSHEMAEAVGKKVLPIRPWMARIAFFFFWHLTRGRIPTSRGGWRFYSYPVVLDGTKLTRQYNYQYKYIAGDAFRYTDGRYEKYVPKELRKHKTN